MLRKQGVASFAAGLMAAYFCAGQSAAPEKFEVASGRISPAGKVSCVDVNIGLPAEALFHAQQCAEKALKAFLTWHQTPFTKTHESDVLKELCLPLITQPTAQLQGVGPVAGTSRCRRSPAKGFFSSFSRS